jgi:cell division protein FtsI (penicillin-binding protein 3)
MVDGPKNGYYAATTAAPLFRKLMETIISRYHFPPTHPDPALQLVRAAPTAPSTPTAKALERLLADKAPDNDPIPAPTSLEGVSEEAGFPKSFKMPNLRGLSLREALKLFEGNRFQVKLSGSGFVKEQTPAVGSFLEEGDKVEITLNHR